MILGKISSNRQSLNLNRVQPHFSFGIIVSLLIFSFFSGVRYDVGVDYLAYLENYKIISTDRIPGLNTEIGFQWLTNLFAKNNIHFAVYFATLALFQIIFIYFSFNNERYLLPFIIFVLMTNGTYFTWMNGIRQSIVFCIFVYNIKYIKERKIVLYLSWVFIGYLFHKSAILLIPLYFILRNDVDLFKGVIFQLVLLFSALILSEIKIWNYFVVYLEKIIDIVGYKNSYGDIQNKMSIFEQNYTKGIRFYFPLLLNIITTLYSFKLKKAFNKTSIKIFYNIYFIGALSSMLFYNNTLMRRPALYFIYMQFIISAYLLFYLKVNRKRSYLNYFLYIFIIFIHIMILYAYISSNFHTQYHFFWEIN